MKIDFQDKVVLITGGCSGAGEAIVKQFAATGCKLAVTYNSSLPDKLLSLYPENSVKAYKYNQANVGEAESLINAVMKDFGRLDVLVNNAGIYPAELINEITEEDFDNMFGINTKGVFFLSREAAKRMKNNPSGGAIINISSINAANPAQRLIHYGMSKAAIEMETRCLAYEYGPDIRVNCIAPGLIYKEGQEKFIPGWTESYCERAALHRLVKPEEIGNTAVFLSSDLASAITGQIITVDCGVSLAPYFDNSGVAE